MKRVLVAVSFFLALATAGLCVALRLEAQSPPALRPHVAWISAGTREPLPREMVYFARAAALIEGLGVHYDPRFNPIVFAAPIALRMRRRILASLGDKPATTDPNEWLYTLSGVVGTVAGLFARAGRDFLSRLEAEVEANRPRDIPRAELKRLPAAASQ